MQRDLILRRLGQEEPGVEAPRRKGRRDPVRERRHEVGGDLEILGLDEIDDGRLVLGEPGAPARLDALEVGRGDQGPLAALAGQQDAAFLEGLAHAGDAELQLLGRQLSAPPQRARNRGSPSASSSLPPGKTSAPEKASIWWWRTTMKTSSGEPASPGLDGRSSSTVVAGRARRRPFRWLIGHGALSHTCWNSANHRAYTPLAVPQRKRTPCRQPTTPTQPRRRHPGAARQMGMDRRLRRLLPDRRLHRAGQRRHGDRHRGVHRRLHDADRRRRRDRRRLQRQGLGPVCCGCCSARSTSSPASSACRTPSTPPPSSP